jgi:hypothetical protein
MCKATNNVCKLGDVGDRMTEIDPYMQDTRLFYALEHGFCLLKKLSLSLGRLGIARSDVLFWRASKIFLGRCVAHT